MRRTLRGRLALVATLVTAGWVLLLTVALDVVLVRQLDAQAGELLRARAEAAAGEVRLDPDGRLQLVEPVADGAVDAPVWIYDGNRVVEAPPRLARLTPVVESVLGRGTVFRDLEGRRLYAQPVRDGSGRQVGTIVAVLSLRPYATGARLVVGGSVALGLLLVGSVYPITRLAVGRALRPVAALGEQADRWSAADVTQRFGRGGRPEELEELAADLDGLLDRLAAALRHERRLSAEISHELRTPLARITAEAELLQRERGDSPALQAVLASAAQMDQILSTLLAAARSESTVAPGRCRLDRAVRAASDQAQLPEPVRLEVMDPPASITAGADEAVVVRILAPLLDNAGRYARSAVRIRSGQSGEAVWVDVTDDGPGLGDLGERAFEPGVTGSGEHGGAGLGLALARRLARAAGGDVTAAEAAPGGGRGGATLVVTLPRA